MYRRILTKQVQLEDLSKIRYEVHTGTSNVDDYLDIMILKFSGRYEYGSNGSVDAGCHLHEGNW